MNRFSSLLVAVVGAACGSIAPTVDGGDLDADAGTAVDGTDAGLVTVLAPATAELGVDLVRCLALKGVDTSGATVAITPSASWLSVEVGPSAVATRGDANDCPAETLPVLGVASGIGFVELRAALDGTLRTSRATFQVSPVSGALTGTRNLVLQLGSSVAVDWQLQPTGRGIGALGRLPRAKLDVQFTSAVAQVELAFGARRLVSALRGQTTVTLRHPAAPEASFALNVVDGMPLSISSITSIEPATLRSNGGRLDVGACATLSVAARFRDGATQYTAPWADAPIDNVNPTVLRREGDRYCGLSEGEAVVRSCFGGTCGTFAVFVGPAPTLSLELTGSTAADIAGVAQCVGVPVRLLATTAAGTRDVTRSAATWWLPLTEGNVTYNTFLNPQDGTPETRNGNVCWKTVNQPVAGSTVTGKLSVKYGDVLAQTSAPITITVNAP